MNWFYLKDNQQLGPVSQEQIEALLQSGEITPQSLVWQEGMADWKPAGEVFVSATPTPAATQSESPYAVSNHQPAAAVAIAPGGDGSINAVIKRASFPKVLTLLIIGWVLFGVGFGFVGYGEEVGGEQFAEIGGGIILAGAIPLIWGGILSLIYLYRCWLILNACSNAMPRTTPGKAVGFNFIPLFHLYWTFQAYGGWAKDYNVAAQRNGWQNNVPEGLFTGYAVVILLSAIPLINNLAGIALLVIMPMTLFHMCKTINFHANAE
jgi:hypothetical protein